MPPRRISLALLIAGTTTLAVALAVAGWPTSQAAGGAPGFAGLAFWLAYAFAAECLWIRTRSGEATISMASAVHIALAFVFPPGIAILVAAGGSALAESLVLRKPRVRVLFNAAQAGCAVGLAAFSLRMVAGVPGEPFALLQAGRLWLFPVAAFLYGATNTGLVAVAVGLDQNRSAWQVWRVNFANRYELASSAALCCLGLSLAFFFRELGMLGGLLVVLPLLLMKDSYDRYLASAPDEPTARNGELRDSAPAQDRTAA